MLINAILLSLYDTSWFKGREGHLGETYFFTLLFDRDSVQNAMTPKRLLRPKYRFIISYGCE